MVRQANESKIAQEYIKKLESIGWFDGFPKEALEITKKNIEKDKKKRPDFCLHGLLISSQSAVYEGMYREITLGLAKSSYGLFKPASVAEKWGELAEGTYVEISIIVGGKEYAHEWIAKDTYIDENFDYLLKEVIERVDPKLTLGSICLSNELVLYLVCNKTAYLKGVKEGLFLSNYKDLNFSDETVASLISRFRDKKSPLRFHAGSMLKMWFEFGWFDYEAAKLLRSAVNDRNASIKKLATEFVENFGKELDKCHNQETTLARKLVRFNTQNGYIRTKDQRLTERRARVAQEYLSKLDEVGWFEALPKTLRDVTQDEIADDDYNRPDLCLPGVYQYLDCVENTSVHKALIESLCEHSHKIFVPTKVEEKWTKSGQVTLIIENDIAKFSAVWKQKDNILTENFENVLKSAIEGSDPKLTLGTIFPGDGGTFYLICNKSAYEKALAKGLFLSISDGKLTLTEEGLNNLKELFSNIKSALRLFAAELLTIWFQTNVYKESDLEVFQNALTDPDEAVRKVAKKLISRFGKVYSL
jgi:hypothetical protein